MITNNPISNLLAAPLNPDWTIAKMAEQLLCTISQSRDAGIEEDTQEFVLDADAVTDQQTRRLLRPLLACLSVKSAEENGTQATIYGGPLSFKRPGPDGPVWILGQFDNRQGSVRISLRLSLTSESVEEIPSRG